MDLKVVKSKKEQPPGVLLFFVYFIISGTQQHHTALAVWTHLLDNNRLAYKRDTRRVIQESMD